MSQAIVTVNEVYLALYDLLVRYILTYGGRRSGKSFAVSQLLVLRALQHAGRKILVLRKFAVSLRLSVWARVQEALREAGVLHRCEVNKGERRITLPNGSEFLFSGCDDPERLKSLEGITDVWFEEVTEVDELDFDTVDAGLSTRCDPLPQIWMSHNPVPIIQGAEHWLQRRFINKYDHELGVLRTTDVCAILRTFYGHNHFCPAATIKLLNGYKDDNPDLYRMWALGEFVRLRGAILENWDVVQSVPEGVRFLGYGLDWGFADDPATVIAAWQRGREIWVEEKIYGSGMTNPDLNEAMLEVGIRRGVDDIIADSAEPKSIEDLSRMGWMIRPCEKKTGTGGMGGFKRSAALFLRGLTIHALEESVNLRRELGTWSWRQDKDGNVLPMVQDGGDHTIDSLIYRVYRPGGSLDLQAIEDAKSNVPALRSGSIISSDVEPLRVEAL